MTTKSPVWYSGSILIPSVTTYPNRPVITAPAPRRTNSTEMAPNRRLHGLARLEGSFIPFP